MNRIWTAYAVTRVIVNVITSINDSEVTATIVASAEIFILQRKMLLIL